MLVGSINLRRIAGGEYQSRSKKNPVVVPRDWVKRKFTIPPYTSNLCLKVHDRPAKDRHAFCLGSVTVSEKLEPSSCSLVRVQRTISESLEPSSCSLKLSWQKAAFFSCQQTRNTHIQIDGVWKPWNYWTDSQPKCHQSFVDWLVSLGIKTRSYQNKLHHYLEFWYVGPDRRSKSLERTYRATRVE